MVVLLHREIVFVGSFEPPQIPPGHSGEEQLSKARLVWENPSLCYVWGQTTQIRGVWGYKRVPMDCCSAPASALFTSARALPPAAQLKSFTKKIPFPMKLSRYPLLIFSW